MKRTLLFCLVMMLSVLPALAGNRADLLSDDKPVINDKMDEINYAVGHQVGRDLKRQHVEVRPEVLWQGIVDGATGDEALMSMEDMLDILIAFRADIVRKHEEQKKGYRLRGQEYLAENGKKPGVIVLPSGLQYQVLQQGRPEGKTPTGGDTLLVKYISHDIEGRQFGSSIKEGVDEPVEVRVDKMIPGWQEALKLMREGARWKLFVPSRLGFRDSGPMAGQTTVFELELVEVLPRVYP
ncbi:hypothetical protein C2E25_00980 [Geothermobacter hydrogeniphilus]|uniref:Peptidyl-prolyl cis-trans isomerase n=1 Tax=Geothermobacter hydrogeniphilus TaxID=1969733 RepID=A0A2K2HEW0_9BACT|nr:FKBP-type peptidyl-prolyl cis-trans isomerase N-terminal domain-containing protein [Geothermobacter hydrogeniphilus]PNU21832.1 hypothetical protein C2E25_00980 [Geothermobacter hydrogeniphilus]